MEPVDSVEGLAKFYLYTEVSSEFEVTSGGLGDSQEKVTITVNNNGDEAIPEPEDTDPFDSGINTFEPGTTEMITPNLDGPGPDEEMKSEETTMGDSTPPESEESKGTVDEELSEKIEEENNTENIDQTPIDVPVETSPTEPD